MMELAKAEAMAIKLHMEHYVDLMEEDLKVLGFENGKADRDHVIDKCQTMLANKLVEYLIADTVISGVTVEVKDEEPVVNEDSNPGDKIRCCKGEEAAINQLVEEENYELSWLYYAFKQKFPTHPFPFEEAKVLKEKGKKDTEILYKMEEERKDAKV